MGLRGPGQGIYGRFVEYKAASSNKQPFGQMYGRFVEYTAVSSNIRPLNFSLNVSLKFSHFFWPLTVKRASMPHNHVADDDPLLMIDFPMNLHETVSSQKK